MEGSRRSRSIMAARGRWQTRSGTVVLRSGWEDGTDRRTTPVICVTCTIGVGSVGPHYLRRGAAKMTDADTHTGHGQTDRQTDRQTDTISTLWPLPHPRCWDLGMDGARLALDWETAARARPNEAGELAQAAAAASHQSHASRAKSGRPAQTLTVDTATMAKMEGTKAAAETQRARRICQHPAPCPLASFLLPRQEQVLDMQRPQRVWRSVGRLLRACPRAYTVEAKNPRESLQPGTIASRSPGCLGACRVPEDWVRASRLALLTSLMSAR